MTSPGVKLRDTLAKTIAIGGAVSEASKEIRAAAAGQPSTLTPASGEVPRGGGNSGETPGR